MDGDAELADVVELRPPLRRIVTDDGTVIWCDGDTPQTSAFAMVADFGTTETEAWETRELARRMMREDRGRDRRPR